MKRPNRVARNIASGAAALAVAVVGGYYAGAGTAPPAKRSLEQRVNELETKVSALESQLGSTQSRLTNLEAQLKVAQSKLDRVTQPGPQLIDKR